MRNGGKREWEGERQVEQVQRIDMGHCMRAMGCISGQVEKVIRSLALSPTVKSSVRMLMRRDTQ